MLNMSHINHIRDLAMQGYQISEIEAETHHDHKTIQKYLEMEDFSPTVPLSVIKPSILDPYKPTILKWLDEDRKHWYKQHHTAKRVFDRLIGEEGFNGSYDTVQRYIKTLKESRKQQRANQELVWEPGAGQVDFGEADFYVRGICRRLKYLVVSFPFSNDGFVQVFGGETSECVCQGLKDIFEYIGGVPPMLVFDNATGVGRRVRDVVHESRLFSRFRAHYHFMVRFCNPESGWEKGNVERKVGYERSNLFVPIQSFDNVEAYNSSLLPQHEKKAAELHYKKAETIHDLFKKDQAALIDLPVKQFDVCRYEEFNADGYGKICMEGRHYYSTRPEFSRKHNICVGIRAHYIDILDDDGKLVVQHERQYGEERTDVTDYSTTLAVLMHSVGAWNNSGVRRDLPDPLRDYLDKAPRPVLKDCLCLMSELNNSYGYESAIHAMNLALRNERISHSDAKVIADRITGYGIDTPAENGPNLKEYDIAFNLSKEGDAI